jgi:hypothetical protein
MNNVANSATERTMQLRLLYLLRSQPIEKSVHDMIQLALQVGSASVESLRFETDFSSISSAEHQSRQHDADTDALRSFPACECGGDFEADE